nr:hypothetical protein HmN_000810100 [Hymenolepis microstoma]
MWTIFQEFTTTVVSDSTKVPQFNLRGTHIPETMTVETDQSTRLAEYPFDSIRAKTSPILLVMLSILASVLLITKEPDCLCFTRTLYFTHEFLRLFQTNPAGLFSERFTYMSL